MRCSACARAPLPPTSRRPTVGWPCGTTRTWPDPATPISSSGSPARTRRRCSKRRRARVERARLHRQAPQAIAGERGRASLRVVPPARADRPTTLTTRSGTPRTTGRSGRRGSLRTRGSCTGTLAAREASPRAEGVASVRARRAAALASGRRAARWALCSSTLARCTWSTTSSTRLTLAGSGRRRTCSRRSTWRTRSGGAEPRAGTGDRRRRDSNV
mmetsp:Transcript_2605/g.8652  ORF Transcript_2605/g.8652 Transcript_2605/m.8652 type:complete len:216 (-) Transcript_2605:160-807(-)